jgi:hypothetical protein
MNEEILHVDVDEGYRVRVYMGGKYDKYIQDCRDLMSIWPTRPYQCYIMEVAYKAKHRGGYIASRGFLKALYKETNCSTEKIPKVGNRWWGRPVYEIIETDDEFIFIDEVVDE